MSAQRPFQPDVKGTFRIGIDQFINVKFYLLYVIEVLTCMHISFVNMFDNFSVRRISCVVWTLFVARASFVVAQAQGGSDCPKEAGPVPLDDPTIQQVALLLASKWYNPADHPACNSLPTSEFLDTINVTQACVDPPYAVESVQEGTPQTFFVSFDGTVPCSKQGKETLLKEDPDIPFTLQFEAEATYASPGNGNGMLKGELVGPETKPVDWSTSGPIQDLDYCPEGTVKGKVNDPDAMKIAKSAASAYYKPEEHGTCGSQPLEDFLSSIKIMNVCVSPDGSQSVSFDATTPCTDEGKKELLAEKPYAFTFQFEASGDEQGNPASASIVGGDGKLAPSFTCPSDECTFIASTSPTPIPGPSDKDQSAAKMPMFSALTCIILLFA